MRLLHPGGDHHDQQPRDHGQYQGGGESGADDGVKYGDGEEEGYMSAGDGEYVYPPLKTHLQIFEESMQAAAASGPGSGLAPSASSGGGRFMQRSPSAFGELGAQTAQCMLDGSNADGWLTMHDLLTMWMRMTCHLHHYYHITSDFSLPFILVFSLLAPSSSSRYFLVCQRLIFSFHYRPFLSQYGRFLFSVSPACPLSSPFPLTAHTHAHSCSHRDTHTRTHAHIHAISLMVHFSIISVSVSSYVRSSPAALHSPVVVPEFYSSSPFHYSARL